MSQLNIEPPKIGRPDEANCMDRAAKPKLGNNEEKGKILTTFWTQILYTVLALLLQKKENKKRNNYGVFGFSTVFGRIF